MANLLNIGKSGLLAAQVGLSTTGHNIANVNTIGYSRQVVLQQSAPAQNLGTGFVGSGTEVTQVKRYYDDFLATQVRSAQSGTSALDAYSTQIAQVDNMLADATVGLSPALQDFFNGAQDLSANPASPASRQALLSGAESLAASFQGLSAHLTEIGTGVDSQIASDVTAINSYARQIAKLNDSIANLSTDASNQPNDLLDQRDVLVTELNKYVKATVVPGDNNTVTVSIGSGQPMVVGKHAFELAATSSPTDPSKTELAYVDGNNITILPANALAGGELGGLTDFRANTLERVQKTLGSIAISLASAVNAQHKLGQDSSGAAGADLFSVAPASVIRDGRNDLLSTTDVQAKVSDPSKLIDSNYNLTFTDTGFVVTRQSDGTQFPITPYPQTKPQTVDGVDYTISSGTGGTAVGDSFTIKPTLNGAAGFSVLLSDGSKIAAAAPVRSGTPPATNTGSAQISSVSIDKNYLTPGNALSAGSPVTLTYANGALSFDPAAQKVTVTSKGVDTEYAAGTPVPYNAGDKLNFGGINLSFSGTPANKDTFTVEQNQGGVGDNRNAALLGKLQTSNVADGGKATFQGAYAEMVSFVGNKTREVQIDGKASAALLAQTEKAQQNVSGVNLDEEGANLLRYQQAYQAAGKVMQIASQLFDILLSLGQ